MSVGVAGGVAGKKSVAKRSVSASPGSDSCQAGGTRTGWVGIGPSNVPMCMPADASNYGYYRM